MAASPARRRTGAGAQRVAGVRGKSEDAGDEGDEKRPEHRRTSGQRDGAGVDGEVQPVDLDAARQLKDPDAGEQPPGDGHGERGTRRGKHRTLDRDAACEPRARGAERQAHRKFVTAGFGADQEQHPDGAASNQQKQADGHGQQAGEMSRPGAGDGRNRRDVNRGHADRLRFLDSRRRAQAREPGGRL